MTADTTTTTTTSDERVMAALAHFFGLIAALIVYVLNKDKSRFVRFQALQALALDGLWMMLGMGFSLCLMPVMMLCMGLGIAGLDKASGSDALLPVAFSFGVPWIMLMCLAPFSLLYLAARLVACISVASGRDFRYPLIGKRVEAFLKDDPTSS